MDERFNGLSEVTRRELRCNRPEAVINNRRNMASMVSKKTAIVLEAEASDYEKRFGLGPYKEVK